MSSETEIAMVALHARLDASTALPPVRRDAVFEALLDEIVEDGKEMGVALVLRHGEPLLEERLLGGGGFNLERHADVEWIVAGEEGITLNTTFDEGIEAIFAAIESDPTLGGFVRLAEIDTQPEIANDVAGGRAVLSALIRVKLTFHSPRAY